MSNLNQVPIGLIDEVELAASVCRDSFSEFVREFWDTIVTDKLHWNWHMEFLCQQFQEIAERVFRGEAKTHDLAVNVPPGTSKSSIASIFFPAWVWTRMPHAQFICGSYSESLALDLSRKCRLVVGSDKYRQYYPEIVWSDAQDSKHMFVNTKRGFRLAVGAGGTITGLHAHFIVIDDPLNPRQAVSELELNKSLRWLSETVYSRCVDASLTPLCLIMQRLHQNDPTAQMLGYKNVRHICLPASDDFPVIPASLRCNYVGGLLDPKRLPLNVLANYQERLGKFAYAGQYGQCLVAGTMVKTLTGYTPIEQITPQDCVQTRQGWQRVLWAGATKEVSQLTSVLFSNASVITGTEDHPIWTKNRGWVGLDALRGVDLVISEDELCQDLQQAQLKLSSSTDNDTLVPAESNTFAAASVEFNTTCTETFGSSITEVSPLATMFITKTKTHATIKLKIWNALLRKNTASGMEETLQAISHFLTKFENWQSLGINPTQAKNITENTVNVVGQQWSERSTAASNAESLSSEKVSCPLSSVPSTAQRQDSQSENQGSTQKLVSGVSSLSPPLTIEISVVLDPVATNGAIPVYDISVENCHEFLANGILAHNSPIPLGGGMFMIEKLIHDIPLSPIQSIVRFWDKAATHGGGAYTAGVKLAKTLDGKYCLLDVIRKQVDSATRENLIKWTAYQDGPDVLIGIEQEGGSGGKQSAQETVANLAGYRVTVVIPQGNKALRADPFSSQVNAGNVYICRGPWNAAFIEEMQYFPHGTFLDQIDAASGAFSLLAQRKRRIGAVLPRNQ